MRARVRTRAAVLATAAVALMGASNGAHAQPPGHPGRAAIERYGCALCHTTPGVVLPASESCTGCHQELVDRPRTLLARGAVVSHFVDVPDLRSAARRLRPDYLAAFLESPHDVRPRLEESMPRLPVTPADAAAITAYLRASAGSLAPPAGPTPSPANVARGRTVFASGGCAMCHAFGNHDPGFVPPPAAVAALGAPAKMAPNLRLLRARMTPDAALAWIRDPASVDPHARMPRPSLSTQDAVAVRDFLFLGEPGVPARPRAPPSLDRDEVGPPPTFASVRRIFARSCMHCHAHTSNAGTIAALGFDGVALDLSTRDGVLAGALLPDGSRRSIVAPGPDGIPPLLGRLLRRHAEAARDVNAERADTFASPSEAPDRGQVGMPLGLPALPAEDIALLARWLADPR